MARHRPVWLERLAGAAASGAAAPVMGTGIVSAALELDGERLAALALLVVAAALAVALACAVVVAARREPGRVSPNAATPGSLTVVAAGCVLGTRLTQLGWRAGGGVLLACAVMAWVPLLYAVLRRWRRPARGDAFLVSVATTAISVLCAALGPGWPTDAAVPTLAAGLALYGFVAMSFDVGELRRGHGDQWVAGGALAIAALAAATTADGEAATGLGELLTTLSLVLWASAMAWLPALVVGELLRPRLGFDARRWSTVFPIGMYAAMSHVVGRVAGRGTIVAFARGWTWVAVAVWAVVALASVRRARQVLAGESRDGEGTRCPR